VGIEGGMGQTCSSDDGQSPAPDALIQMINRNCLEGCNTLRCACRKHGLQCTSACGHCQDGNGDNMKNDPVIDDDEDEV